MSDSFKGVFTALITPFFEGDVDFESLKKLVNFQLSSGIKGFVVNGTTAESPNLNYDEVKSIFDHVKSLVPRDFPIVVGTGSNSTDKTVEFTRKVQGWGADAALVVTPYYNKPTQEGLYLHFKAVSECSQLPIIIYNVPGRTITEIEPETTLKLSVLKNIIGIKEASADMFYIDSIKNKSSQLLFLSGDDGSFLDFCSRGGDGVISVISHIIPKELMQFMTQIKLDKEKTLTVYNKYNELLKVLYIESNPIPVKMALYLMEIIRSPEMRLPLTTMSGSNKIQLEKELQKLGII